jgi:hypothetical protein
MLRQLMTLTTEYPSITEIPFDVRVYLMIFEVMIKI